MLQNYVTSVLLVMVVDSSGSLLLYVTWYIWHWSEAFSWPQYTSMQPSYWALLPTSTSYLLYRPIVLTRSRVNMSIKAAILAEILSFRILSIFESPQQPKYGPQWMAFLYLIPLYPNIDREWMIDVKILSWFAFACYSQQALNHVHWSCN